MANNGNQNSKLRRLVASERAFIYRRPPNREEVISVTLRRYTGWNYLIQRHLHVGFSPTASRDDDSLGRRRSRIKSAGQSKAEAVARRRFKASGFTCRAIKGFFFVKSTPKKEKKRAAFFQFMYFYLLCGIHSFASNQVC